MEANPHIKVDLEKYKNLNPNDQEYKNHLQNKETFLDKEQYHKVTNFNTKFCQEDISDDENDDL